MLARSEAVIWKHRHWEAGVETWRRQEEVVGVGRRRILSYPIVMRKMKHHQAKVAPQNWYWPFFVKCQGVIVVTLIRWRPSFT